MSNKIAAYLKPENVRIIDCVKDWREAINVSTHPLVVQGYITDNYSKRVIQLTEEHGSYYIVGKDIALVHARPEDGVIRQQLAITVIHKPVAFFDKPGILFGCSLRFVHRIPTAIWKCCRNWRRF